MVLSWYGGTPNNRITDGPCDHIAIAMQVAVAFRVGARHFGNVTPTDGFSARTATAPDCSAGLLKLVF